MACDRQSEQARGRETVQDRSTADVTASLLESQTTKPAYVTFPACEEPWRPSPGFWWIETGACVGN